MPCGPVKISRQNDSNIIQIIADMSTPKAGGTKLRTGTSKGSVGHMMALKGITSIIQQTIRQFNN